MMITSIWALAGGYILAHALTPMVLRWGVGNAVFAQTCRRSVHRQRIATLGGVALFGAVVAPILLMTAMGRLPTSPRTLGILGGGAIMLLLGVWDDLRGLGCYQKLAGQALAAVVAVAAAFHSDLTALAPAGFGGLASAAAVLWIVSIANAVNLIDGLDGLAAGAALIGLAALTALGLMAGAGETALVVNLAVAGALLGFLWYNWHPARIFMGDSGSLFLGYLLALAGLEVLRVAGTPGMLPLPVLILGVPILDTAFAFIRRLRKGQHPFHPDNDHLHHRLYARLAFSQRRTVAALWVLCAVFGLGGVLLGAVPSLPLTLTGAGLIFLGVGTTLHRLGLLAMPGRVRPRGPVPIGAWRTVRERGAQLPARAMEEEVAG